ncbi:MAG: hypothetical protein RL343_910 [Actinomycetota bacterium]|jgi:8-oxo-dGTP diphosphatase
MTIYAAGAVLWREVKGELLVALVHRSRYNDWAWAKGKVDPGETLPQTAVREIREETGLKVKLGVKLPVLHYNLPNGEPKEVHYWAAQVSDKALEKSTFKPDDEVAEVVWLNAAEARAKFTYPDDEPYLAKVEELFKDGLLETQPFILLRHAKATPRTEWKNGEATRPLLPFGKKQAKALVPTLNAFGIKKVVSSPWARCRTTVEPYAKAKGYPVVERTQLTEFGNKKGPQRTTKVVHDLLLETIATVLCSHRPALPTIIDAMGKHASGKNLAKLLEAKTLAPGHLVVAHLSMGKGKQPRKIVGVEFHSPGIEE